MKRGLAVIAATAMAWSAIASAGGHKVLVLPIEGDADPALRKQLTAVVASLARSEGGTVTTGDTTFAETAAAIGCEPGTPTCAEQVRAGMNVDELVYGSAFDGNGQVIAVISKVEKGQTKKDQTVTILAHQKAETAEGTLRPMFGGEPAPPPPPVTPVTPVTGAGSAAEPETAPAPESGSGSGSGSGSEAHDMFFDTSDHKMGVGFAAGGGLLFVIGLALWSSESGLQNDIDNAATNTSADIASLRDLEDRASTKAWEGNVLVVVGLAAAGVGAYFLIRNHPVQATVAPVEHANGAAVLVGGRW